METAQIGDGLGLFEGVQSVQVDNVKLNANQRAQAIIDRGGAGIRFGASNSIGGGQDKIVIQHTTETVDVPVGDVTPGAVLPFRSAAIGLPQLMP
jgi:hypothetical protein